MDIFKKISNQIYFHGRALLSSGKTLNEIKMLTARSMLTERMQRGYIFDNIHESEFKVFSQFGEDGIIQYLIAKADIPAQERSFVEFGAEIYAEANTRFLVQNNNWRGLLIECMAKNVRKIKRIPWFWMYNLTVVESFVTPQNINQILTSSGFSGDIGLLSIDIDGVDYWVWEAITAANPAIVVCEYNSVFGYERALTTPFRPDFYRMKAHSSGLFFGCSLRALEILGDRKGYALVGSNSSGNNAFFVRRDRLNGLRALSAKEAYVESQFRESVDERGEFTFTAGKARAALIADMMIFDVELGREVRFGDAVSA